MKYTPKQVAISIIATAALTSMAVGWAYTTFLTEIPLPPLAAELTTPPSSQKFVVLEGNGIIPSGLPGFFMCPGAGDIGMDLPADAVTYRFDTSEYVRAIQGWPSEKIFQKKNFAYGTAYKLPSSFKSIKRSTDGDVHWYYVFSPTFALTLDCTSLGLRAEGGTPKPPAPPNTGNQCPVPDCPMPPKGGCRFTVQPNPELDEKGCIKNPCGNLTCDPVPPSGNGESDCICPMNYAPVCGEDGRTYGNECELQCAKVRRSHAGECSTKPRPPAGGPTCGNNICETGEAQECPACIYANPPCLAPCKEGSCPKDCPQAPVCGNKICEQGEAGSFKCPECRKAIPPCGAPCVWEPGTCESDCKK